MKKITFSILLLLLTICFSYSQKRLSYDIYTGIDISKIGNSYLENWGNPWIIGLGINYHLNENAELGLNGFYQNSKYTGENLQLAFLAVAGLKYSVEGENTNIYQLSMVTRLYQKTGLIRSYFVFGTGVYFIDQGTIIISTWFNDDIQEMIRNKYFDSGKSITQAFGSFGIGIKIKILKNVDWRLESSFIFTVDEYQSFLPLLSNFSIYL